MPEDSIVCLKCGKVLTKDEKEVKKLKYLQSKVLAMQRSMRVSIPREVVLDTDEYVLFSAEIPVGLIFKKHWIVTDKRIVAYEKEQIVSIKYGDVVSIHPPSFTPDVWWAQRDKWSIVVETFEGSIGFDHVAPANYVGEQISKIMTTFYERSKYALELSERKTKNPDMLLCNIQLKE